MTHYADEYAAALEPARYAKATPVTASDYTHGEGREVGAFVRRVAAGRDPHATSDMIGLARAIHENGEWDKLPVFADAVDDAGHPAAQHYDFRNADDAVRQLGKWRDADSPPSNWKSSRHYIDRRRKFADALRRLGRHGEAALVADHTKRVMKFSGHGGAFMPLIHSHDFDRMTRSYANTALWSSNHQVQEGPDDYDIEPLDENHTIHDLDLETSSLMADDVRHFRETLPEHLRDLVDQHPDVAGHALWLSRNHHGSGLWDRDEFGEHADALHEHAVNRFGEHDLYVDRHPTGHWVHLAGHDGHPEVVSTVRTNSAWRQGGEPRSYKPGHDSEMPF